jgi:hypothetical protein
MGQSTERIENWYKIGRNRPCEVYTNSQVKNLFSLSVKALRDSLRLLQYSAKMYNGSVQMLDSLSLTIRSKIS